MTMKRIESITCDGDKCDHVRENDSNHWLVGLQHKEYIMVARNRGELPMNKVVIHSPEQEPEVKDFCGEECIIKWVSKMLTEIRGEYDK